MVSCTFPYNGLLASMTYQNEELNLSFKKPKGVEQRVYAGVPQIVAYTLLYKRTGSDVVGYYSRFIKKKFRVIKVF